ncbi:MAG: siphovirus Gp157 family protein [Oscillospiraceae bacterium]|nr:siphovirus Gp157 family protein [Oscillospiraceae bacterium]
MGLTLYQIDSAIKQALDNALAEQIDPETGEIIEGNFDELEQLSVDRTEKIENIGAYIKSLQAEADAIKAEEDNLKRRRRSREKEIDRLKGYVADSLLKNGQDKFKSAKVEFSFKESKSVNVLNLEAVPAEYIRTTIKHEANKTEIGKLLKSGQAVPGCELEIKQNLQMK